ncbi:MAG: hypothetical protein ABL901_11705 [Hyphomicrobiaceae bacterium]
MSRRQDKQTTRDNAVKQIADDLCAQSASDEAATFLIGAGLSVTAGIPLAPALVIHAIKTFPNLCQGIAPNQPGAYGAMMSKLTPKQRRAMLKPHIDKAKLNWGHIALASLMAERYVGRVMSVNFDPVLARACGLLGLYPAIYDFGAAPASNVKDLAEPAIIHLHGQSSGFVQLNAGGDTAAHVSKLKPVITASIQNRLLVVIGYSGHSDGVVDALSSAYDDHTRLYWVDIAETPSQTVSDFLTGKPYAHFVGGADADRFLLDLVQEVARRKEMNWTPKVFHDPIGHLLDGMRPVADFPVTSKDTDDILKSWRENMALMKTYHDTEFSEGRRVETLQIQGDAEQLRVETAQRSNTPNPALIRAAYWDEVERADIAGDVAKGSLDDAPRLFRVAIEGYERAINLVPDPHEALNNWGTVLSDMALRESGTASLQLLGEARIKYEAALSLVPQHVNALQNLGNVLGRMGVILKGADGENLLLEARTRLEAALEIEPFHENALNNWGAVLLALARETDGSKRQELLKQADSRLMACDEFSPGIGSYPLACIRAYTGQLEECRRYLLRADEYDLLPERSFLEKDTDLDSVRGLPWFAEILALAK